MARITESLRKSPGWMLLPLRLFLGFTFTFAGLQKLANPGFFNASNPASIEAQIRAYQLRSPIHLLLGIASHAPVVFGLIIALGELAVGVGVLLGVFTRLAALGGIMISFMLFLAVSFHSHPYYIGSDIVFVFAWTPLLIFGDGQVASLEANVKRKLGIIAPLGTTVGIDFGTITRVCGHHEAGRCRANGRAICQVASCPVLNGFIELGQPRSQRAATPVYDPERRRFLVRAGTVGVAGGTAVVLGTLSAGIGRILYQAPKALSDSLASSTSSTQDPPPTTSPATTAAPGASAPATTSAPTTGGPPPKGTAVGPATAVPVGQVASFTDPASGEPAYVLHPSTAKFVAFSAICPHAGCTVQYAGSDRFVCPCHGSAFNALTGAVLNGPAATGLTPIPIAEGSNGQLYVDG
ncbi:MAG: DoxX family membrane protein [Actinomycetota bacterium]|nr:DoxX family membrane protein [Actinomycetota bacterium]